MSAIVSTLAPVSRGYKPATSWEMSSGVLHALKKYGQQLDPHLVGVLVNATFEGRKKQGGKPLAWIAAAAIRQLVPPTDRTQEVKYEACKGAVMKVMNFRSQAKKRRDKMLRKRGIRVPALTREQGFIEDPRCEKQFLFI